MWLLLWDILGLAPAMADGPVQVGLYIQYEDGSAFTQCVELDGPDATGLDVLQQAGLGLIYEPGSLVGSAVCKIGETGCDYPAEDCFCQCPGNPCHYWTYWYAEGGEWKLSSLGASNRAMRDGDVEGWVWGDGKTRPPAEILAQGICSAPQSPTSVATQELEQDTPLPPTPALAPSPLATSATRFETATRSAPSATAMRLPAQTSPSSPPPPAAAGESSEAGSPPFVWLMAGLSGLGVVLLGLAYWFTSRRS
jgi:hypothetical protein